MRRAITITSISYMFFGASILVFISALLNPLLKESPSPMEKTEELDKNGFTSGLQPQQEETAPLPEDPARNGPVDASPQASGIPQQNPAEPRDRTDPVQAAQDPDPGSQTLLNESAASADRMSAPDASDQPVEASPPASTAQPASIAEDTDSQNRPEAGTLPAQQTMPEDLPREQAVPAEAAPEKPSVPPDSTAPKSLLVLGDGFFASGEITPGSDARRAIDQIIPLIQSRPKDDVLVEGHADKILSTRLSPSQASKLNKTVSLRRAIAVAMVLEQKGVASDRIIVSGRGDSVPIASNLTEEGRAKNRRVEIKLSPAQ
ncbi:MAG: OmpA family protein [Gammaproteobacteria bacterium]